MSLLCRGVQGVKRTINSQKMGIGGVNRNVIEQLRGVEGVNRKVFSTGLAFPILYDSGKESIDVSGGLDPLVIYYTSGVTSGNSVAKGKDNTQFDMTTPGVAGLKTHILLPYTPKYTKVGITLSSCKLTSSYSTFVGCRFSPKNIVTQNDYYDATNEPFVYNSYTTEKTFYVPMHWINSAPTQLLVMAVITGGSTGYTINAVVKKIWLE